MTDAFSEIGRLTNEERFTHRSNTINGPEKGDFTAWYEWNIYPSGAYFDKPLILLTDRYTIGLKYRTEYFKKFTRHCQNGRQVIVQKSEHC